MAYSNPTPKPFCLKPSPDMAGDALSTMWLMQHCLFNEKANTSILLNKEKWDRLTETLSRVNEIIDKLEELAEFMEKGNE